MPANFDRAHYLVTFGGTSCSGIEEWQTGIRFAPSADKTPDDLLGGLLAISVSDIFDALGGVISNITVGITYPTTLVAKWAKVAVLKRDGTYAGAPKIAEGSKAGQSSNAFAVPPQLAWAVTLATGKEFGMAQKGRMYWPVPVNPSQLLSGTTGQTDVGYTTSFRDKVKSALDAVEGEVSTIGVPVFAAVMSSGGGKSNPGGVGTTNAVTTISVGRALDTQRSRRRNIDEAPVYVPALRGTRDSVFRAPSQHADSDGQADAHGSDESRS